VIKYILSDWERKNVFVKPKESQIPKLVNDVILNLRRILIAEKINELTDNLQKDPTTNKKELFEEIMNYTQLKKLLFDKLHRVV